MEIGIKVVAIVAILFIALLAALDSVVIVGAGERGVQLEWGRVTGVIYNEGLYFKTPIAQSVNIMDVKIQKLSTEASAASRDLQIVTAQIAVNYNVKPDAVANLRQKVGLDYKSKVIDPAIQEAVKAATAKYTAEELITKRAEVRDLMRLNLQQKVDEVTEYSISIVAFNIENFNFGEEFNKAIESKVTAEQNALKAERDLERIKVEAQQKIAEAQGQANATIQKAQAEAEAIRIQAQALKENPDVLQLRYIEKWNGQLPTYLFNSGSGTSGFILNLPTP